MIRAIFAFGLCLAVPLAAPAQVRDGAAPKTGTSSISGTLVSDSQPSRPVRRALVSVTSSDRTIGRTAITDDGGRFAFTNLPAGRYNVDATKRGWINTSYGAKAVGRPGRSITLADGERAQAPLRMARAAAITGVVLDHTGQPPTGVAIRVLRYTYSTTGERRLAPSAYTSWGPDERGAYRVHGLAPGEYYVSANAGGFLRQGQDLHLTSDVDVQEAMRAIEGPSAALVDVAQASVGLSPILYPGATSPAQATPVVVRAGEERTGIDFTIQYVRTSKVQGTITSPTGSVPPGIQINLIARDAEVPGFGLEALRRASLGPAGRFEFSEITPGQYTLVARVGFPPSTPEGTPQVLSAVTDLDIQGEDVTGVSLTLQEGLTISGVVRLDGASPPPPLSAMRAQLSVVGTSISVSSPGSTFAADGRFTIAGVTPGRYRLTTTAPGPTPRWVVRSVTVGERDALDSPVDVRESISDVVITLTDRVSELSGRLDAGANAPDYTIVLFSDNPAHWTAPSRRVAITRTASDGSFIFRSVPPGTYLVAAVEDVEPGQWYDPAFLQRLVPAALKIAIDEGEKKTQDIRVGAR